MYWIKFIIFSFGLQTLAAQACDSSSHVTQCSDGKICRNNRCEDALYCGGDGNDPCATIIGLFCVSDYCQPSTCTSTGQCVHGHVCSQDTARACVYPVISNVKEGLEFTLAFKEPGTLGRYEEIQWFKGDRGRLNVTAVIHPFLSDKAPHYYNDLCSGNSPCGTSDKAHLNRHTGELTIHRVKLSDEGFYYYKFSNRDGSPDTGVKYEYKLNVYDCDSSSDVAQCSDGKICRNKRCENALYCGVDSNPCLATPRQHCTSDYCQPYQCTSTGQCVHGHVCSQDTDWRCVYPVFFNVEEGSEFRLAFKEPGTSGSYEEILWYKGGRRSWDRAAVIHPVITENKTQYYNNFCSDESPCRTSDRAHLNISTGEFTIFSVKLSDEDFYYYEFYSYAKPNTGFKYEYKLNVFVLSKPTIEGVQSDPVEVGKNLNLTCTVDRIKPLALKMYWVVDGRIKSQSLFSTGPDMDGAYTQTSTYMHVVTRGDQSVPIRCVVVPVYGDPVEVEAVINPGFTDRGGLVAGCVIGVIVLVVLVTVAVFVCKKYRFNIQIQARNISAGGNGNQQENPVNNNVNAEPSIQPPNQYHYIDVGAMARPGDEGYVNPALTTYEDIL